MEILPVGAEFFHADERADITKQIVAFRIFAKNDYQLLASKAWFYNLGFPQDYDILNTSKHKFQATFLLIFTRVGTLIVATIYLQLIQNRYMFRSFTVLQCSHQHCVQPVASDVEVVGYL